MRFSVSAQRKLQIQALGYYWFWRIAWLLTVVLVTVGSLIPGDQAPLFSVSDKLVHFTAYFILSIIPSWRFEAPWAKRSCLAVLCLGAAIEFGQIFVPGRSFDLVDMAANTGGVLLGAGIGAYFRKMAARLKRMSG